MSDGPRIRKSTRNLSPTVHLFNRILRFATEDTTRRSDPETIRAELGMSERQFYSILTYLLSQPFLDCDDNTRKDLLKLCVDRPHST